MEHIAIVVSPLKALIQDQLIRCQELSIKTIAVRQSKEMSPEEIQGLKDGAASLIFISPESLKTWENTFDTYNKRVCLIAIDEAHCLSMW